MPSSCTDMVARPFSSVTMTATVPSPVGNAYFMALVKSSFSIKPHLTATSGSHMTPIACTDVRILWLPNELLRCLTKAVMYVAASIRRKVLDWYSCSWTRAIDRMRAWLSENASLASCPCTRAAWRFNRLEIICMLFFTR